MDEDTKEIVEPQLDELVAQLDGTDDISLELEETIKAIGGTELIPENLAKVGRLKGKLDELIAKGSHQKSLSGSLLHQKKLDLHQKYDDVIGKANRNSVILANKLYPWLEANRLANHDAHLKVIEGKQKKEADRISELQKKLDQAIKDNDTEGREGLEKEIKILTDQMNRRSQLPNPNVIPKKYAELGDNGINFYVKCRLKPYLLDIDEVPAKFVTITKKENKKEISKYIEECRLNGVTPDVKGLSINKDIT